MACFDPGFHGIERELSSALREALNESGIMSTVQEDER